MEKSYPFLGFIIPPFTFGDPEFRNNKGLHNFYYFTVLVFVCLFGWFLIPNVEFYFLKCSINYVNGRGNNSRKNTFILLSHHKNK